MLTQEYPMTPLNIADLFLTAFCILTLLLVFLNPCGSTTKSEQVLDTILLVVRNGVQFLRLGAILKRSGHSLFHPPKPIDLSQARAGEMDLDMDFDYDLEDAAARRDDTASAAADPSNHHGERFLDTHREPGQGEQEPRQAVVGNQKGQVGYGAGREGLTEDDEAQWDRMG